MNIKIYFDFHDVFVDAEKAWIFAFQSFVNTDSVAMDYKNRMSKKDICRKYHLDYPKVEDLYRKKLEIKEENVNFARKLSMIYEINLISMARRERLIKDIQKFQLEGLFSEILAKEDMADKISYFKSISDHYDWILYFNHEKDSVHVDGNIIYIPVDMRGNLDMFKDISFTEHAKNKLLYNELSEYYMNAIANDTAKETHFIEEIYCTKLPEKNNHVLDCCCGVGRHDYLLAQSGYQVTGVDISANQIATAQKIHGHSNANYMVMDVRNIDIPDQKFDMAICMWTTYNYLSKDEDFISFIQSVHKHQNENSILILDAKNIPALEGRRVYKRNSKIADVMDMELLVNKYVMGNVQNSQYLYFINENGKNKFLYDEEFVRFYSVQELTELVDGYYKVSDVFGDFDMSAYHEKNSERLIVVLQKI